jgi:hypothetical protein
MKLTAILLFFLASSFAHAESKVLKDTAHVLDTALYTQDFRKIYKVWVRLSDGTRKKGFLYRLNVHSIVISERNPGGLDSVGRKQLELTTIQDTQISQIRFRRRGLPGNPLLATFGLGLTAAAVAYVATEEKPSDGGYNTSRLTGQDAALLVSICSWAYTLPVAALFTIPRTVHVGGNPIYFRHAMIRMSSKTGYTIYGIN